MASLCGHVNIIDYLIKLGAYDYNGSAYLSGTVEARKFMRKKGFKGLIFTENPAVKILNSERALCLMNMDLDELFRQYVGKNTLNFFRQDHGYKDGSYIKIWNGEEDNEVLANLVKNLDAGAEDFQQQLYAALEEKYPN